MSKWSCAEPGPEKDLELCRLCRDALEKLNNALDLPSHKMTFRVDIAENAVARLRDILIDDYRSAASLDRANEIRGLLETVNIVLSLITGVVYPAGGFEKSGIESARNLLAQRTGPCSGT